MDSRTLSRLTLRNSGNGMPSGETSLVRLRRLIASSATFGRDLRFSWHRLELRGDCPVQATRDVLRCAARPIRVADRPRSVCQVPSR